MLDADTVVRTDLRALVASLNGSNLTAAFATRRQLPEQRFGLLLAPPGQMTKPGCKAAPPPPRSKAAERSC